MARLPFLLPRGPVQPAVVPAGASAVHSAPPALAPKLTAAPVGSSAVKMALAVGPASSPMPLSLAPVVNGPGGLISPPGSVPVINMILPSVTVPPAAEVPAQPKGAPPAGRGVNGCEAGRAAQEPPKAKVPSKRLAEASGEAGVVKRKRGRPRKKLGEPEKGVADRSVSSIKEESDIIVVTVGYGDHAASPSQPEESSELDVVHVGGESAGPPREASGEGPSLASGRVVGDRAKAAVLPSQVSVIKGRKSAVPVVEAGSLSREAAPFGPSAPVPADGSQSATTRDSQEPQERRGSFESDPQPTDLSRNKSALPSSKDHPDDSGSRAPSVRFCRLGADQGQAAATPGPSATAAQAPSR